MTDNGRIEVGDCRCPGALHGTDWVDLRPDLSFRGGVLLSAAKTGQGWGGLSAEMRSAAVFADLAETEIKEWSFLSEEGLPVPIQQSTIDLYLSWEHGGARLAEALAKRLDWVDRPFPKTTPRSSASGRTRKPRTSTTPASTSPTQP